MNIWEKITLCFFGLVVLGFWAWMGWVVYVLNLVDEAVMKLWPG